MSERSSLLLLDDRAVAATVRAAAARIHGDYGAAACSSRFSGELRENHPITTQTMRLHNKVVDVAIDARVALFPLKSTNSAPCTLSK